MKHLAWLVVLTFFQAPAPAQESASSDGTELFEARIRPVLVDRCYSCHSARAEKLKGELRLDLAEGLRKVVVPGDPDRSPLIASIRYRDENLRMPPKQKLTGVQIEDFEAWVRKGAPDPRALAKKASEGLARSHWAFQPLRILRSRPSGPPIPSTRSSGRGSRREGAALAARGQADADPARDL
jgi:hypothetical protein